MGGGDVTTKGEHMKLTADHVVVDVDVRSSGRAGYGIYLAEPVRRGDLLVVFGGSATPGHVFRQLPADRQRRSLQVADDVYLVTEPERAMGDCVNHSCDPTAVFEGQISLVARRDLAIGEQITFDYATSDSWPYDEFECECGEDLCRSKVTGEDWMDPDLQRRYAGNFSTYLQRKIDRLTGSGSD